MNWLLYIGGWWFGLIFIAKWISFGQGIVKYDKTILDGYFHVSAWTAVWVWFMWRFIA